MTATILRADARAIPLPDASVDLIVTSPPYYGLRSYTDGGEHYAAQIGAEQSPAEFVASLIDCTREWMRVLKPTGSMFVNLGDSYYSGKGAPGRTTIDGKNAGRTARRTGTSPLDASGLGFPRKSLLLLPERYRIACLDQLGLVVRAVAIWSKPNGLPEGQVRDRVHRTHEDWVHLTLSPSYYSDCDAIRQPHAAWTAKAYEYERTGYNRRTNADRVDAGGFAKPPVVNPLGKMPGSVWEIAGEPLKVPEHLDVDHFAAFPIEWPRRIVQGWSPAGGTVLDPFGGTGTTALVASVLGRHGISVDRSADYCRLARWRTTDPAQRAKAARQPKPAQQLDGQGDLFGFVGAVA
ncbi:DNA modification methylase [Micromonospora sp. A200]|uniref:DNA-methyltransferase n=1 Tax=Micromonospora sp. A200 TaxID=2940568 RepID=UPI00247400F5|nr:site-specific DNA-methyltransferase [Micromonospora sp. A200]MDH6460137.1 DNA modification methylase [Micromonospora sp. A200]